MSSVTLKDVAKVAGVSYATVSRALSGSPEIGEKTRIRILNLCREMGYTPNSIARSMVRRCTNTLGLVVPSLNDPFMSELTAHLEIYARSRGYNLMACSSSYDRDLEKKLFSLLLGRQADGIVMIPEGHESYESLRPLTGQVPTVFIGENMKEDPEDYVSVDNRHGMQTAVEYLYSLGHRGILYLGARPDSRTHQLRLEGYLSACEKLGIGPRVVHSGHPRSSREAGCAMAHECFSGNGGETAILCASDMLAIGVMQAAAEAGVRIPEDVSLMGFDDISFAGLPGIELTTVAQPARQMAVSAVDMLLDRIRDPGLDHEKLILPTSLVVRGSCRAVAG